MKIPVSPLDIENQLGNYKRMQNFTLTRGRFCSHEFIDSAKKIGWSVIFPDDVKPEVFKMNILSESNTHGWKMERGGRAFYIWFSFFGDNKNILCFGLMNSAFQPFRIPPIRQIDCLTIVYHKFLKFEKTRGISRADNILVKKLALSKSGLGKVYQEAYLKNEYFFDGQPRDVVYYGWNDFS